MEHTCHGKCKTDHKFVLYFSCVVNKTRSLLSVWDSCPTNNFLLISLENDLKRNPWVARLTLYVLFCWNVTSPSRQLSFVCAHNQLGLQKWTSTLSERKGRAPQPSVTFSCQAGGWWWGGGVQLWEVVAMVGGSDGGGGGRGGGVWWCGVVVGGGGLHNNDNTTLGRFHLQSRSA